MDHGTPTHDPSFLPRKSQSQMKTPTQYQWSYVLVTFILHSPCRSLSLVSQSYILFKNELKWYKIKFPALCLFMNCAWRLICLFLGSNLKSSISNTLCIFFHRHEAYPDYRYYKLFLTRIFMDLGLFLIKKRHPNLVCI